MSKFTNLNLTLWLALAVGCSDATSERASEPGVTVVPFRMVVTSPVVEVTFNGEAIDLLFDLGRGDTVAVFPSQLAQIDKTRAGTASSGLSMTGPTGEMPIYEVDIIGIGDIEIANAKVVEDFHDENFQHDFSSQLDAYGFVGTGLFGQYKVIIDYPGQKLTFIPPDARPEQQSLCAGVQLPLLQGQDWGIAIKVDSDIGELDLVWDTGSPENGILKRRTDASGLDLIDGDTFVTDLFAIETNDIGPQSLVVWDWSEHAPPFDGLMGYDFFAENVVCIDFPKQTMLVRRLN